MTDPQVIRRTLTVSFGRSVSIIDQKPDVMQVTVFALSQPSSPEIGTTFVSPAGVQRDAQPDVSLIIRRPEDRGPCRPS